MIRQLLRAGILVIAVAATGCTSGPSRQVRTVEPIPKAQPPSPVVFSLCSTDLPTKGMWKSDPLIADFNGDGVADLAALPRLGRGPRAWLGNGRGGWQESSSGLAYGGRSCGGGLDSGDINGDGHIDLAVADHCQGVFIYLGDGTGSWTMTTRELYPSDLSIPKGRGRMFAGAEDLALADFDGDGYLDIVVGASDDGGINVYYGDGSGTNWTRDSANLPSSGWSNRVAVGDFNADGQPDILASYAPGPRVFLGNGDRTWNESSANLPSPMVKGLFSGLGIGDINKDGLLDFTTANWVDGPEVYLQAADGSWNKTPDVFPAMKGGASGVALADVDLDGNLDIVTSGRLKPDGGVVRGVFLLLGDGTGAFRYVENCRLPATGLFATPAVSIGDINGDGLPDIAAGSGLTVESSGKPLIPAIEQRLLIWCTERNTASH